MAKEIGQRVGAVRSAEETTVYLFGFGTYKGEHVPPDEVGGFNIPGIPNPRIRLDNGKDVYGCECWWGPEEQVKEIISGRKVVYVDIDETRQGGST